MGRGRLAASHGMQQAISTPAPRTYAQVDWATHQAVMREMGQTGTEGQGYINTSQAYIVNRYLRKGGDIADAHKATPNWSWLTKADVQQTIHRMDRQMRPLSRDIQGVRFVGPDFLKSCGFHSEVSPKTATALQSWAKQTGGVFSDKAYTSFSTDATANVFTAKEIRINYKISKGTRTIMTSNKAESEGVLARGVQQRITGARWKHGKLEINVTV